MISSPQALFKRLEEKGIFLPEKEKAGIEEAARRYRMVISEAYFDLINWEDPDCPIKKQCVPSAAELSNPEDYSPDPLNEKKYE